MILALLVALSDTLSTAERARIRASIVHVSEQGGRKTVRVLRPDGTGARALVAAAHDAFPAAVSPDGRRVAVVATRDSAGRHLERLSVVRLADGAATHFPIGIARARNPSWSPDGRWLAVETDRHGFADVVRLDLAGRGEPRRLTDAPQGSYEPDVSPRGDRIAFVTSRDGDAEVYLMRADGTRQTRLTAFHRDDWRPRWSPDGGRIAFLSARSGSDRLYVVRADGTGLRAVGDAAEGAVTDFAWSPDGRRIAYVARTQGARARIRVAELRTGARRALTDGRSASSDPAWSPDGRYLAFTSDRDGDGELYLMRADGGKATRLTRSKGADWLPRWAAE